LPLLRPNVAYNNSATDAAREAAIKSAPPAIVVLKRNQTVAREGDTVTPQMLAQFAAIREYSRTERRPQLFIGLFLFACALNSRSSRLSSQHSSRDCSRRAGCSRRATRSSLRPRRSTASDATASASL